MHISKLGWVAVAGAALAAHTAALAAGSVVPANGKLTGTAHYKFRSRPSTGRLTLAVARHEISLVGLVSPLPPLDARHSQGNACGAITVVSTKGYKAKGSVSPSGRFRYTFTKAYRQGAALAWTDTIKLAGRFTDPKHATGTYSETSDWTAASAPGKAHCESGRVKFAVAHR